MKGKKGGKGWKASGVKKVSIVTLNLLLAARPKPRAIPILFSAVI